MTRIEIAQEILDFLYGEGTYEVLGVKETEHPLKVEVKVKDGGFNLHGKFASDILKGVGR